MNDKTEVSFTARSAYRVIGIAFGTGVLVGIMIAIAFSQFNS